MAKNIFETTIPIEAVGLEATFSPFIQFCTGQRTTMFSSNLWQAVVTHGAEYPLISSGIENQAKRYSFNTAKRDNDVMVFESIPKFVSGIYGVKRNPKTYIIVLDKGVADYIEVSDYTKLYNGFGYENRLTNAAMFANQGRGTPLDKDTVLTRPPNHKDNSLSDINDEDELYCQGINANVVFTTLPHVAEDSIIISKSFAKKCEHHAIYTTKITLKRDEIPLNLYGTLDEPKVFPDIGDAVGAEGILMAIRRKSPERFASLTSASLRHVLHSDDKCIHAPVGAKVVDIQVYYDSKTARHDEKDNPIMSQLLNYQSMHHKFHDRVCKMYDELMLENIKISPKLNDLITESLILRKQKVNIPMIDGRDLVTNCVVEITYSHVRPVGLGFKFAGRVGNKGVNSCIWDDADMPIDEQGVRADVVASPDTVPNRLNPAQWYEQFYNRLSTLMQQRLIAGELGTGLESYKKIIQYIIDVHGNYGKRIKRALTTTDLKMDFVDEVRCHGFYFVIPPFSADVTMERIQMLRTKYNYVKSPITFSYDIAGRRKTFTTKQSMTIGSQYMYLLGKIPKMQMSAHEMTHINQFGLPVKSDSNELKNLYATKPTPIRFGEDEIGLLSMLPSPEQTARFIMVRAGCKSASDLMASTLLTADHPSAIGKLAVTTQQMLDNSETIKLMNHMMGVVGVDMGKDSIGRK